MKPNHAAGDVQRQFQPARIQVALDEGAGRIAALVPDLQRALPQPRGLGLLGRGIALPGLVAALDLHRIGLAPLSPAIPGQAERLGDIVAAVAPVVTGMGVDNEPVLRRIGQADAEATVATAVSRSRRKHLPA